MKITIFNYPMEFFNSFTIYVKEVLSFLILLSQTIKVVGVKLEMPLVLSSKCCVSEY